MPNVTIYLPDDLAADVKLHELPVSRVCQVALRRKVRAAERAVTDPTYRQRVAGAKRSRDAGPTRPAA